MDGDGGDRSKRPPVPDAVVEGWEMVRERGREVPPIARRQVSGEWMVVEGELAGLGLGSGGDGASHDGAVGMRRAGSNDSWDVIAVGPEIGHADASHCSASHHPSGSLDVLAPVSH